MEVDIAILTAPREPETLSYSIKSLRAAIGNVPLSIIAEPGSYHITGENMTVYLADKRLGILHNYDRALKFLVQRAKYKHILILSDDIVYHKSVKDRIQDALNDKSNYGYYALFSHAIGNKPPRQILTRGWNLNPHEWKYWHGLNIIRLDVARKIPEHSYYKHRLATEKSGIDWIISDTVEGLGFNRYIHNPSPTYTIGQSTIGHTTQRDGLNYEWVHELGKG